MGSSRETTPETIEYAAPAGDIEKRRSTMKFRALTLAAAVAGSFLVVPAAVGQAGETFTATASVKWKGKTHTAPVRISVTEMSSETDRSELMKALKKGGTHAGMEVLQKMKDRGTIDAGEWKAPIRYAF